MSSSPGSCGGMMSIRQTGRVAFVHSLLGASSNSEPRKIMASYPQQTTHSLSNSESFSISNCMATQNLSRSLRRAEALNHSLYFLTFLSLMRIIGWFVFLVSVIHIIGWFLFLFLFLLFCFLLNVACQGSFQTHFEALERKGHTK